MSNKNAIERARRVKEIITIFEEEGEAAGLSGEVLELLSTKKGRTHICTMIESLKAEQLALSTSSSEAGA